MVVAYGGPKDSRIHKEDGGLRVFLHIYFGGPKMVRANSVLKWEESLRPVIRERKIETKNGISKQKLVFHELYFRN